MKNSERYRHLDLKINQSRPRGHVYPHYRIYSIYCFENLYRVSDRQSWNLKTWCRIHGEEYSRDK